MPETTLGGAMNRPSEEQGSAGLRGWVLFPAVVLVLMLFFTVGTAVLLRFGSEAPLSAAIHPAEIVILLIAAFIAYTLFCYLRTKRRTRILVLLLFGLILIGSLSDPVTFFFNPGLYEQESGQPAELDLVLFEMLRRSTIPAIVFFYFLFSKRVKATFIN